MCLHVIKKYNLPASLLHQKLGVLHTACAEGWAHREGRILELRTLPSTGCDAAGSPLGRDHTVLTATHCPASASHLPLATSFTASPSSRYWTAAVHKVLTAKGQYSPAKWPLLLYSPALKLFCEVHSFVILGIEIWFYISFSCLHNSAHYQVRRDHNGKITFGRKMLVILYCKGKKIVKAYVSFLEKHEGKTHTISRAIASLNQSHLFFPV